MHSLCPRSYMRKSTYVYMHSYMHTAYTHISYIYISYIHIYIIHTYIYHTYIYISYIHIYIIHTDHTQKLLTFIHTCVYMNTYISPSAVCIVSLLRDHVHTYIHTHTHTYMGRSVQYIHTNSIFVYICIHT